MGDMTLTDEQWCVLDLLIRARQRGVQCLNRIELLQGLPAFVPQVAGMRLAFAALSMPDGILEWRGQHDFSITERGVALYNFRFGKKGEAAEPTTVADEIICLPGPEHYTN